jgi:hypothetical protein
MPATPLTARSVIHRKVSATVEVDEAQKWLYSLLKDLVSFFIALIISRTLPAAGMYSKA